MSGGLPRAERGFTLLEVMVAMAILALALTVIAQTQQAGMREELRAKMMTIATMLAREKMTSTEEELFEDEEVSDGDFDREEEGDFDEEGFANFKYSLKIERIELPAALDADALTDTLNNDDEQGAGGQPPGPGAGMAALGSNMLAQQFQIFRKVLEESIRRLSLEVSWKEGRVPRSITVVSYFTDPRRVDKAAGGGISLPSGLTPPVGAPTGGDTSGGSAGTGASVGGASR